MLSGEDTVGGNDVGPISRSIIWVVLGKEEKCGWMVHRCKCQIKLCSSKSIGNERKTN
jgi:hypothetical protein